MEKENHPKPFISQRIGNFVGGGMFVLFFTLSIAVVGILAYQMHIRGEYQAEVTGMLNYLVVSLVTMFIGAMGMLFGISQKDMRENNKQQVETNKKVGAEAFVQMQIDKMEASPSEDEVDK